MFQPFHDVVSNVAETVLHHEERIARPVIGVMPAYFPMELIHGAGGYPVQLWGNNLPLGKSDAFLQTYCCSVARSMLELELTGKANMVKAYAFTSLCDTLINLREIYRRICPKPTMELSIPMTRTEEARQTYLKSVIHMVNKGLEEITGQEMTIDSLEKAAKLYGRTRALQRQIYEIRRIKPGLMKNHDFYTAVKAGFFLPADTYHRMLDKLIHGLDKEPAQEYVGPKLLLSGMVFDPMELMKILDDLDVAVVDDDFANGWRTVSKKGLQVGNLVEGLSEYLFHPAPCCCLYNPDVDRHSYLVNKVKKSNADGVLFWYIKFCEPDAFDRPQLSNRLKEEGIPTAFIDVELSMTGFDAVKTRINAFCEILEG